MRRRSLLLVAVALPSQGNAGPSQVSLIPAGGPSPDESRSTADCDSPGEGHRACKPDGGLGAARSWGRSHADAALAQRALQFPRDHGAHPESRTEWWYLSGWQGSMEAPTLGFQLSFFRHRTGLGADSRSRFAPRQLLFAHAAVTDLHQGRHRHAQRIARWSGDPAAQPAAAALDDARLQIGRWRLARSGDAWQAQAHLPALGSTQGPTQGPTQEPAQGPAHELALDLRLRATQPLLLQGDAGWSRKGPDPAQASHYYSLPQFALQADTAGRFASGHDPGGRAWLDHEWSDELLHPEAVGWDWAGINLADGAALTVFRLRLRDGSVLWAGGSWRPAAGTTQAFRPQEVDMQPRRHWSSTGTGGRYPVEWSLRTPAGEHHLRALLDAQELDARASTGNVYWEGLSELLDVQGRRVGLGYLELTGYAAPLRL